jgi:tetratricopeptide (TPR) repeat protein|tara:strand:- start:538 stop:2334 length:1797 start_codon:yes stop_codon:yes gene_type:complete
VSQSLNEADEQKTSKFEKANATFGAMMRRGRSYSGRERNCVFLNTAKPDERFANISATSGIDLPDDGRALVATDWDHDGDLDVWISNRNAPRLRFFRNDVPSEHHHLTLRLQGTTKTTNRDAIGARIEVILTDGRPLIKTLRAGQSFLSQSTKWIHFGLGDAESIESVKVQWPGGETETFPNLEVDQRYSLIQNSGKAEKTETQKRQTTISPSPVDLPPTDSTARIHLASLLPMARLNYQTFDGASKPLPTGQGKAYVLSLWASWCPPCEEELQELAERAQELRDAGIEIIALAVDGLDEDNAGAPDAEKMAKRLDLPFTSGRATRNLISYLQSAHDYQITGAETLPVPVSFLIDGNGKISVIYKGKLNPDHLKEDLGHSQGTPLERFARSAPLPGRTLPIPTVSRHRNQYEAQYRFATFLQQRGLTQLANAENKALIKSFPKNAGPHNNLGISYIRAKKIDLAEASFREALRIQPDHGKANANLGTLLAQKGKLSDAIPHLKQAVKSNQQDGKILAMLSQLLLKLERWPEAQTSLEKALKLNPNSPNHCSSLGFALAKQGQLQQAVEHLEQALKLEPTHADARRNLTTIRRLIEQGQ